MVSYQERQMAQSHLPCFNSTEEEFTYTVTDQYKEMRARCMLTTAYFGATKDHYSNVIEKNSAKIAHLQKTMTGRYRFLNFSKSAIMKSKPDGRISNLRKNFELWATKYTQLAGESSVGMKYEHVAKLILQFDQLLHDRQKRVDRIKTLKTEYISNFENDVANRKLCEYDRKVRILETNCAKMKEKLTCATELNNKYKKVFETLQEQTLKYPIVLGNMEKELKRMQHVYQSDFVVISHKADFYLKEMLTDKRHIQKKNDVRFEVRRKLLLEWKKKSIHIKKEITESQGIRRLTRAMFEIDQNLLQNNLRVSFDSPASGDEQLKITEEDYSTVENRIYFLNSILSSNDYVETFRLQEERTKMLEQKEKLASKRLNKMNIIFEKLKNEAIMIKDRFCCLERSTKIEIRNCERMLNHAEHQVQKKLSKISKLKSEKDLLMSEMTCVCDRFVDWAKLQQEVYRRNSFILTDKRKLSDPSWSLNHTKLLESFQDFRNLYFKLQSAVVDDISKLYEVYPISNEKQQLRICKTLTEKAQSEANRDVLITLRSRFSRVETRNYNEVPKRVDSNSGTEDRMRKEDDLLEMGNTKSREYKSRKQIKKISQKYLNVDKTKMMKRRLALKM